MNNFVDNYLSGMRSGAARIRRLLRGRWPYHLLRAKIINGINVDLDPDNYIERKCLLSGFYEIEVLDTIMNSLRRGDVFWDIGANIGIMSLAIKGQLCDVQVYAFECNPLTAYRLSSHASQNQLSINVVSIGLSNTNGVSEFHIMNRSNSGVSSLTPWNGVLYENKISVATMTAVSLVESQRIPAPNVVKIDVEGHELEVLMGFGHLLELHSLRSIIFEAADEVARCKITGLLEPFGFEISPIASGSAAPIANYHAKRRDVS